MTTVLLDLEETVIDDWSSRNILQYNIEKIKRTIQPGDRFGIFSWAVWDERDLTEFNLELRAPLEDALGITFSHDLLFSMDAIAEIVLRVRKKRISRDDMYDLFGKEECLLTMLRGGILKDHTTVLIDDKVDHGLAFSRHDCDQMVVFANIDQIQ